MSKFSEFGSRIAQGRERLGLSREEFARRVGCAVDVIELLEANRLDAPTSILAIIDRIAEFLDTTPELLMFSSSTIFEVQLNELRRQSISIIHARKLSNSLEEVVKVLAVIEDDYQEALFPAQSAKHFRLRGNGLSIDEDRIRDILRRIRGPKS